MKKLIIILLILSVLMCGTLLTACDGFDIGGSSISQDYSWASAVEQTITVSNNGGLCSEVLYEYVKQSDGSYAFTKTTMTLNSLDSGNENMYNSEIENGTVSSLDFHTFSDSNIDNLVVVEGDNGSWTGTLTSSGCTAIGLSQSDISGDVSIVITNSNGNLVSVEIEYLSANGNEVVISTVLS